MAMLKWGLGRLIHGLAVQLESLADLLYLAADALWRPVPAQEANRILRQADRDTLRRGVEALRCGLRWGLVPPRPPFADRPGWEVAAAPPEYLLDVYGPEIVGRSLPLSRSLARLRQAWRGEAFYPEGVHEVVFLDLADDHDGRA